MTPVCSISMIALTNGFFKEWLRSSITAARVQQPAGLGTDAPPRSYLSLASKCPILASEDGMSNLPMTVASLSGETWLQQRVSDRILFPTKL